MTPFMYFLFVYLVSCVVSNDNLDHVQLAMNISLNLTTSQFSHGPFCTGGGPKWPWDLAKRGGQNYPADYHNQCGQGNDCLQRWFCKKYVKFVKESYKVAEGNIKETDNGFHWLQNKYMYAVDTYRKNRAAAREAKRPGARCWQQCGGDDPQRKSMLKPWVGQGQCNACSNWDDKENEYPGACCKTDPDDPDKWHATESNDYACTIIDPKTIYVEPGHHVCIPNIPFPKCKNCNSDRRAVSLGDRINIGGDRYMECWGQCDRAGFCKHCDAPASNRLGKLIPGACCNWFDIEAGSKPLDQITPECLALKYERHKFYGVPLDKSDVNWDKTNYHMCVLVGPQMRCNDKQHGFVDHKASIKKSENQFAKSCPRDKPNLKYFNKCSGYSCEVAEDRSTCCEENVCTCTNGKPLAVCPEHNTANCDPDKCNEGYHFETDKGVTTCEINTCACEGGTKTTGTNCGNNGDDDCSACDAGYTINPSEKFGPGNQKCFEKKCVCLNGDAGSGTQCNNHNTTSCTACDKGYKLEGEDGEKTCNAETCVTLTKEGLEAKVAETIKISAECEGKTTGKECQVGCMDGYSGVPTTRKCMDTNKMEGDWPKCEPDLCENHTDPQLKSSYAKWNCKGEKKTGDVCHAKCQTGYQPYLPNGKSPETAQWAFKCTADGWERQGPEMDCRPDPCTMTETPQNGNIGTCINVKSGNECKISCNEGYSVKGSTECTAGSFTQKASCVEKVCAVGTPAGPEYKNSGTCGKSLDHGDKCAFECNPGYKTIKDTTCSKGKLDPGKCEPKCKCELIFARFCANKYGKWTDNADHLSYAGCERFCNEQNENNKIVGCELSGVPSEHRESAKGKWCFAHETIECSENDCSAVDAKHHCHNNAAAKCVTQ